MQCWISLAWNWWGVNQVNSNLYKYCWLIVPCCAGLKICYVILTTDLEVKNKKNHVSSMVVFALNRCHGNFYYMLSGRRDTIFKVSLEPLDPLMCISLWSLLNKIAFDIFHLSLWSINNSTYPSVCIFCIILSRAFAFKMVLEFIVLFHVLYAFWAYILCSWDISYLTESFAKP